MLAHFEEVFGFSYRNLAKCPAMKTSAQFTVRYIVVAAPTMHNCLSEPFNSAEDEGIACKYICVTSKLCLLKNWIFFWITCATK